MIERTEIDGRKATVAHLKGDFIPCDPDEAEFIKIIFDDGEVTFAFAPEPTRRGDVRR